MEKKILVAYASKRGSTAEIAQKIAEVLRQSGIAADVLSANKVRDLSPYGAVVLGSAVYIGLWRKAAVGFLKRNEARLSELPVWLFICGPTGLEDPLKQMDGWFYPKSLRPVIERINPCGITCFGGKIEMKTLNSFERWIVNNVKAPEGDFRDWGTIASWAKAIPAKID